MKKLWKTMSKTFKLSKTKKKFYYNGIYIGDISKNLRQPTDYYIQTKHGFVKNDQEALNEYFTKYINQL